MFFSLNRFFRGVTAIFALWVVGRIGGAARVKWKICVFFGAPLYNITRLKYSIVKAYKVIIIT